MKATKGMVLKTTVQLTAGEKFRAPLSQRSRRDSSFYTFSDFNPTITGLAGAGAIYAEETSMPAWSNQLWEVKVHQG